MNDVWEFLGLCGVAGVSWLLAHGVSRLSKTHCHAIRFAIISISAVLWISFLWPVMGRGHQEEWPKVACIMAWWAAITIGIWIERRTGNRAEPGAPGYRR